MVSPRVEAEHTGTGNEQFPLVRRKVAEQGTVAEQPASVFQIGNPAASHSNGFPPSDVDGHPILSQGNGEMLIWLRWT
jgi:hypothetical protein